MGGLKRFGVSLKEDLLRSFDEYGARKGFANRSEALRHCIRRELSEELTASPDTLVAGVLTIMYDHHENGLAAKLTELQHEAHSLVLSTMHIHLDHSHCLETMVLRGTAEKVRRLSDAIRSAKGILQSSCALSAIHLKEDAQEGAGHAHG